jgi:hypothetical protein
VCDNSGTSDSGSNCDSGFFPNTDSSADVDVDMDETTKIENKVEKRSNTQVKTRSKLLGNISNFFSSAFSTSRDDFGTKSNFENSTEFQKSDSVKSNGDVVTCSIKESENNVSEAKSLNDSKFEKDNLNIENDGDGGGFASRDNEDLGAKGRRDTPISLHFNFNQKYLPILFPPPFLSK